MDILPPPTPEALALAQQHIPPLKTPSKVIHKAEVATLPPPRKRAKRCR